MGPSGGQGVRGTFGSEGLVAAEHVPDRLGEAAGEVDLGDLGAALFAEPLLGALIARAVSGVPASVAGRFDQRPAQVLRALFGERTAPVGITGLVDTRAEAGVASELARRREAVDVADLGGDRVREHPADAGNRAQQRHVGMVGAELLQFAFAGGDLTVEVVDQAQRGRHGARPRLGQGQSLEQPPPAHAEEVGDRAGLTVREQHRVHALLETGAVADEVRRKRARSRSARTRKLGSQIAGTRSRRQSSASTQASMRSVLQANGANPFTLAASAISIVQPASSSWSRTKRAPFIDSIAARTCSPKRPTRAVKPRRPSASGRTAPISTVPPNSSSKQKSRRLRLRSNPTYNITGPPFVFRGRAEHDSAGGPPSSHSAQLLALPPGRARLRATGSSRNRNGQLAVF